MRPATGTEYGCGGKKAANDPLYLKFNPGQQIEQYFYVQKTVNVILNFGIILRRSP